MRYSLLSLACAFVLALATSAVAQSDNPNATGSQYNQTTPGTQQAVSGVVVSSDSHSLSITADDGRQLNFTVDEQSNGAKDLSAGQRVTVKYDDTGGGVLHADDVTKMKESSSSSNNATGSEMNNSQSNPGAGNNSGMGSGSVDQSYGNTSGTTSSSSSSGGTSNQYGNTSNQTGTTSENGSTSNMSNRTGMRRAGMPATASPLPMIGLAGLMALGLGIGLRGLTRS